MPKNATRPERGLLLALTLLAACSGGEPAPDTRDPATRTEALGRSPCLGRDPFPGGRTIAVIGERQRTVTVGDIVSDQRFVRSGVSLPAYERELPICIVVRDSTDITVNVGDIFGDNVFAWAGGQVGVSTLGVGVAPPHTSGAARFDLRMPVEIHVRDSARVTINVEDIFGDNVFVWAQGDAQVSNLAGASGGAPPSGPASFALDVPVSVRVARSREVRVDVEDVVGDSVVTWTERDAIVSNLGGGPGPGPAGGGFAGASLDVRAPVDVRVRSSDDVTVDFENVLGNDVIAWAQADADVSNLGAGRGLDAGEAHLEAPVEVRVHDSRDVLVDIEDVFGDAVVAWAGSEAPIGNLVGATVPAASPLAARLTVESGLSVDIAGGSERVEVDVEDIVGDVVPAKAGDDARLSNLGAGRGRGHLDAVEIRAPVDLAVRQSKDVLIDLEDVFGDDVLTWAGVDADVSNLRGRMHRARAPRTLVVALPFRVDVRGSDRVEVDAEDIFGDTVLAKAGGTAVVSNLGGWTPGPPPPQSSIDVPVELNVVGSRHVVLGIEDVFGDADIVTVEGGLCVSNLHGGARRLGEQLAIRTPLTVRVWFSEAVDVDIEGVFGDSDVALVAGAGPKLLRLEVPVDVRVFGSARVDMRVAEILSNNQLALSEATAPTTIAAPGRYPVPGGTIVLQASLRRRIVASRDAQITVDRFFEDDTVGGIEPDRLSVEDGSACQPRFGAAPPTYRGARPGYPGAFDILVHPGPRLASRPAALAAVQRAVRRWEAVLEDPIDVRIDVAFSDWLPPGIVAQARVPRLEVGYAEARAALLADAGDELAPVGGFDDALTTALPARLSASLPAQVDLQERIAMTAANAKALGFAPPYRYEPDATIVLNAQVPFDLDAADGIAPGHRDLESVVLHEIGHALGFTSAVDAINHGRRRVSPTPLDLHRFAASATPTTRADFTATPRSLYPGRDANAFFLDRVVPMATGERTGAFRHTDGHQARHWQAGGAPLGAMLPRLNPGRAWAMSCADLRAMDLIGYEVRGCP